MRNLAGTGGLVRLILRRDRLLLPLWLVLVAGFVLATAQGIETLLPTVEERQNYVDEVASNPVFLLLQGPAHDTSVGAVAVQQRGAATALFAALGSVLFLVRHTRAEEQTGRRELLGGTVVGRHAPLTAALAVVLGANLVLALLIMVLLAGAGLPVVGALGWGLIAASAGWLAAGLAAVIAQLTQSARMASSSAFGAYFGLYMVRGVGDMGGDGLSWLGWLSPVGWILRSRPFAGERWWLFLLVAALAAVLIRAAYALSARRDLAAGLVPERLGPARAAPGLRNPLGLAWRLHRGMALVWTGGGVLFGLGLGFGGAAAVRQFGYSDMMRDWAARLGTDDPGDALFAVLIYTLSSFSIALYAVMTILRLRAEEAEGGAEAVLSTPVDRMRWAASHLLFALGVPAAILVLMGVGLGLGAGLERGDIGGEMGSMLSSTTNLVPAVWVIAGAAMAAYGLLGRQGGLVAWGVLAAVLALEVGWEVQLVSDLAYQVTSPFAHVHPYLGQPGALTLLALTLVAAALTTLGMASLRRRDVG